MDTATLVTLAGIIWWGSCPLLLPPRWVETNKIKNDPTANIDGRRSMVKYNSFISHALWLSTARPVGTASSSQSDQIKFV